YEEHVYGDDGSFATGTFADYLLPTVMEVPEPLILHRETPSPVTPLGAKGVGEGNCMSTPVCIANAVADALGLADVTLPLTPARLAPHVYGAEPARIGAPAPAARARGVRLLTGEGSAIVAAPRATVWASLLDADSLARLIPGAHAVEKLSDTHFRAEVTLGIGPVTGRYRAEVRLSDLHAPDAVTLAGSAEGALGFGRGTGHVTLIEDAPRRTTVRYRYQAEIGGRVASIAGRLLDGAARVIIGQFFAALADLSAPQRPRCGVVAWLSRPTWMRCPAWLRRLFGRRR
ncbi:MAG: SRPBCC domain-containing protein, partial [Acetobacteraceae bacterium]